MSKFLRPLPFIVYIGPSSNGRKTEEYASAHFNELRRGPKKCSNEFFIPVRITNDDADRRSGRASVKRSLTKIRPCASPALTAALRTMLPAEGYMSNVLFVAFQARKFCRLVRVQCGASCADVLASIPPMKHSSNSTIPLTWGPLLQGNMAFWAVSAIGPESRFPHKAAPIPRQGASSPEQSKEGADLTRRIEHCSKRNRSALRAYCALATPNYSVIFHTVPLPPLPPPVVVP
jgi:hypothetical protein